MFINFPEKYPFAARGQLATTLVPYSVRTHGRSSLLQVVYGSDRALLRLE